MINFRSILENIGYQVKEDGNFLRCAAKYRGGDNPTSLRINKETGFFTDFPVNRSGSFQELLKLSLVDMSSSEYKDLIKNIDNLPPPEAKITINKSFSLEEAGNRVKNYNFYLKKGIDKSILEEFECFVSMSGKMRGRVVFPIFDKKKKNILGFSGRTVFTNNEIKWKHLGFKNTWAYPLFLSEKHILEKRELILVESIGDCLALYNAGIRNVLCLCGIKLLPTLKQEIIRLSPQKILICTNNDIDNKMAGNEAAELILKQLSVFFSVNRLCIKLPFKKDFGEHSKEEIIQWYNN